MQWIVYATVARVGEIKSPIEKSRLKRRKWGTIFQSRNGELTCIMPLISGRPGTVVLGFQLLTKLPARAVYYEKFSNQHGIVKDGFAYFGSVTTKTQNLGYLRHGEIAERVLRGGW